LQVVSRWFDRKLGLALGVANAGIGLGSLFVPMIVAPIITQYSWRHAFLLLAVLVLFRQLASRVLFSARATRRRSTAQQRDAKKAFGLPFSEARRESTFLVLNVAFLPARPHGDESCEPTGSLVAESRLDAAQAVQLQQLFGFGLLFARVAVGFLIDHIFAPRVMMTVSIGGAIACVLYATTRMRRMSARC
jgi:MFS family permease